MAANSSPSAPTMDNELPDYGAPPGYDDASTAYGGEGMPIQGHTHSIQDKDPELNSFWENSGLPLSLKNTLIERGLTFSKLQRMTEDQLLLFAKIDTSLSTDIVLLIGALNDYKKQK